MYSDNSYCHFTPKFSKLSNSDMGDNVMAFRSSSSIYTHLMLSFSHFKNSLSTFSIERVSGMLLWDLYVSDFQRALKIIVIAELFIVMTILPG